MFIIVLIIELALLKVAIFLLAKEYGAGFLGGGNDGDYYHGYATGEIDYATSIWPEILRGMYELGIYSRDAVSVLLFFLSVILIPWLVAKLSVLRLAAGRKKIFWVSVLVVSSYPAVFYFCLDIYRDVFMVFLFLVGAFFLKKLVECQSWSKKTSYFFLAVLIAVFLCFLRPYLGFGFICALIFGQIFSIKKLSATGLVFYFVSALLALNAIFLTGILGPLIEYRSNFHDLVQGGSNIGILLASPVTFIPEFLMSMLAQMFGLYFTGAASLVAFLLESVPFTIAFIYLVNNRRYMDKFSEYLIAFFVVYSVIWILANDNLGTAIRLRIFSYLSIYIACMITYQRKRMHEYLASPGPLQSQQKSLP